jgi:hypothetical protein
MTDVLVVLQVERLSGLIGEKPEKMQEAEDDMRLSVINSTVNIDKRLEKLYELIENDLLGTITEQVVYIAPYKVINGPASPWPSFCKTLLFPCLFHRLSHAVQCK